MDFSSASIAAPISCFLAHSRHETRLPIVLAAHVTEFKLKGSLALPSSSLVANHGLLVIGLHRPHLRRIAL